MNTADLLGIRSLNGSQHFAFEELCCQLVSLERLGIGEIFVRKGRGADAGVECFIRSSSGAETGWQSKFFDGLGTSQVAQLTESFRQAIKKHPDLIHYVVCFPIDLKDGRTGRGKTELERWSAWKAARVAEAEKQGRAIEITLWQATDLRERLYRLDPHYAGRMHFFFDETHFSAEWFQHKFNVVRGALGARYTPEFHVPLHIRNAFAGIGRELDLDAQCEQWTTLLRKQITRLLPQLKRVGVGLERQEQIEAKIRELVQALGRTYLANESYPLSNWQTKIKELRAHLKACIAMCLDKDHSSKTKDESDSNRYALSKLSEFDQSLDDINNAIAGDTWRLVNEQAVLVYGDAGVGKSHLLADLADGLLKKKQPVLFHLNSHFSLQDPRTQILEQLDLRQVSFTTLLGALDAAGQMAGRRALLVIDALNERHGIELWHEFLAPLIAEVKAFPHIALVVSCRTTYIDFVIPDDSPLYATLPRIKHHGFADEGGRAARAYLAHRKIVRPSAPNLLPEFNNPLFLKTCCDSLERQGLTEFPKGVQGMTELFEFYLRALTKKIELRMKLDARQKIPERGLQALTRILLESGSPYASINDASFCLEAVYGSMGQRDRSLLNEYEHEGVLTVEPVSVGNGQLEERVRFTFERFSDFQVATYLLQQHIDGRHPLHPMPTGTPVNNFLIGKDIHHFAGIVEALAVLLPERVGLELIDIAPAEMPFSWILVDAFANSILLRRQDAFTERTKELILKQGVGLWVQTLIAIATEPENRYNAAYLHTKLAPLAMPSRDKNWSIAVAQLDLEEGSHLENLITWATESGFDDIDPPRAELAAILLTWMFTTSNRTIRDRATKALSALLAPRLGLALSLVEKFQEIDDLCLVERLLASIYGAALQSKARDGLAELSERIYDWLFANEKPPAHLLLRDYARGIIELAAHRRTLPSAVLLSRVRPPYKSDWPIPYVAEAELDVFTDTYNGHTFRDDIVSSAGNEFSGDFAKYIIRPAVTQWTNATRNEELGTSASDRFDAWADKFLDCATPAQADAFLALLKFSTDCRRNERTSESGRLSVGSDGTQVEVVHVAVTRTPDDWQRRQDNEKEFQGLERVLLDLLDNRTCYTFHIEARGFLMGLIHGYINDRTPVFDTILAQRWICKHAHDLGWDSKLFGKFDRHVGTGRGRRDKHIERVGKKYQWLALYELLARMADNLVFQPEYSGEARSYDGPWQLWERNIDPSMLISKTNDDGWTEHPAVWWSPKALKLPYLNRQEQRIWLETEKDQMNDETLLDVIEPENNRRWLVLKSFKKFSTPYDAGPHIDSWCRIWCVVVHKSSLNGFVKAVSQHTLIDPQALPAVTTLRYAFLGEYPWHPACESDEDWTSLDQYYGCDEKLLPTVAEYSTESGGYDRSLDGNLRVYLPAPWLIQKLGLHLIDGRKVHYANETGQVLFKDPSVHEAGPSSALVDRAAFLTMLEMENLAPVWIIAGEKGAYGENERDFVGRRVHSCVYTLDGNSAIYCASKTIRHERPSEANTEVGSKKRGSSKVGSIGAE